MSDLVTIHIVFGAASVIVGLLCLLVHKVRGPHTLLGESYHLTTLVTTGSGLVLAFDPFDPALLVIAGLTYLFAGIAYLSAKRRFRRWLVVHAPCMLISVFFLVEAAFITNWELITMGFPIPDGWAWLIPALFFYPAIGITVLRIRQGRYAS